MLKQLSPAALLVAALALAGPASADVILITQAKAQAGNVTPGDTAGFPITISQSGSYRLDSNLTVPNGANGIQVQVANVTIDLNGFTIEGNGVGVIGIYGGSAANSVTIENGTIQRFRQDGLYATSPGGDYWTASAMSFLKNGRYGVHLGRRFSVRDSTLANNGLDGIAGGFSGNVRGNVIIENGRYGIAAVRSLILDNTITENASFGISGGGSTTFGHNILYANNGTGTGEQFSGSVSLQDNSCDGNVC